MKRLLDTDVLGKVCHPRKHADVQTWFRRVVLAHDVLLSDVLDDELRRAFPHIPTFRMALRRSLDFDGGEGLRIRAVDRGAAARNGTRSELIASS